MNIKVHTFLFVLLTIFNLETSQISCIQTVTESPKNTTILLGEDATLRCTVKNQKGDVIWCKDSFCLFTRTRSISDPRISLIGDARNGEHHLHIKNITIFDNANYQCQVNAHEMDKAAKSEEAFLTVLIKPSLIQIDIDPKIKDNTTIRLKTNFTSTLTCSSENSNPPCHFTWYIDKIALKEKENGVVSIRDTSSKTKSKSAGVKEATMLYDSKSSLQIKIADTAFHMKELMCECKIHSLAPSALTVSDSKTLIINYSPITKIWKLGDGDVLDGSLVQFECISDARPPVYHFKWSMEGRVLSSGDNESHVFIHIENGMHNQELKCDATNEVSTQTATYKIQVTYGPKFVKQLPSHQMVKLNERLKLTCDVDSYPVSSVFWEFNDRSIYAFPTLVIDVMRPENYGVYKCVASLKHFAKVSSETKVVPPGPPVISSVSPQYANYGQTGTIECEIETEPKADLIEWYLEERRIDFSNSYKFKQNNVLVERKGIKSQLVIKDLTEKDFANYTCKATNVYGYNKFRVELQIKNDQMGSYFPFAIVFLFFFVTSTIMAFYIFMRFPAKLKKKTKRRRAKKIKKRLNAFDQLRAKPSAMLRGLNTRNYARRNSKKLNLNPNAFNKRNILQNPYANYNQNPNLCSPIFHVGSYNYNYDRSRLQSYAEEENYQTVMDTDV